MTRNHHHGRPPRLATVFDNYSPPIFFVTFNTDSRRPLLANPVVHAALMRFATRGLSNGIGVGRFVIMPDHVHCFVRNSSEITLGRYVGMMKQYLSRKGIGGTSRPHWQEGFFDHLLRSNECYSQKWNYVRENPVRKGLVAAAEDWPYQGEITQLQSI